MGATDWSIRKIFIYNAGWIVTKGVVLGNVIAITLCMVQKYTGVLKLTEADYYLDRVPIEFNIPSMVLINIGTILCVTLFMIIPTAIISKIDPVKTIHFD